MDLCVVCVDQRLHKEIPAAFIGSNVLFWAGYDRPILAFYQSVRLWVVWSVCHLFCSEMGAHNVKQLMKNCVPLSVRRYDGITYGTTHASMNMPATAVIAFLSESTFWAVSSTCTYMSRHASCPL